MIDNTLAGSESFRLFILIFTEKTHRFYYEIPGCKKYVASGTTHLLERILSNLEHKLNPVEQQELEVYLKQKLADLDKQKDMQEFVNKGKLSFGIDSTTYAHLPAWQDLVKRKKQMMKMVWVNAFYVSFMTVFIVGDFWEKFEQHWLKALLGLLTLAGLIMLIYVIVAFYSIFYQFRRTEREVRRLIYQDILHRLKKTEKQTV